MAWTALAGAVLGGIAGGQRSTSGGFSESSSTRRVDLRSIEDLNKGRSQLEEIGDTSSLSLFQTLQSLIEQGPGASEVAANNLFQNQLASQLQSIFDAGGVPTQAQVSQAQQFASQVFAPQRTAMQQAFQDQEIAANRLAARMGRPGTDPILRNKLAQEQTRQQAMLNAEQGAFAAQYAQQIPQNLLNFGSALSNLRAGLASQALQNRQLLLSMGQQLVQNERNYRINTATQTTNSFTSQNQFSGGGTAGVIGGALAGAGAFMNLGNIGAFGGSNPNTIVPAGGPVPQRSNFF